MEYIFYYDIIAFVLLIMLIAIYFMRRNYPTLTNKIYIYMAFSCLVSTVTDLASIYGLSHIHSFPLIWHYCINILYLLSYNGIAVFFYIYVLVLTKSYHSSLSNRIIYIIAAIVDLILLLTTPFTKLIIYFDENLSYCHGSLFIVLYITSIFLLLCATILIFRYRKKLSDFQFASIMFFNIVIIGVVVLQMVYPEQLVGNLACALFLNLLYISLQNPDYYINKNNQCYNQNAFFETLQRNTHKQLPFTLVAFTLDGFQFINQILGLQAANELIDSTIAYLHDTFGKSNVYFLPDCYFNVILEEASREDAFLSELQAHFQTPLALQHLDVLLTPKICILHYPDFAQTPEDINNALEYSFKELFQNRTENVITASGDSLREKKRETQIVHILKRAIRNQEFQVYYQPILDTKTKKFSSAEALIRLWDEELGYISPDEFIPMAEQNGMIIKIGEIVFRNVCEFLKNNDLHALGVQYVEVNLSIVQCIQDNLAQQLIDIMQLYGISPDRINFEITETASSVNADILRRNMHRLIDAGGSFSMDDYGTGFSTANYLIDLPVKIVKIDKSILWSAMDDPKAFIVLRHTIQMLKALHKTIVVEGVETNDMASLLMEMHCDYLQGFLYSMPVPEQEYIDFLQNRQTHPD